MLELSRGDKFEAYLVTQVSHYRHWPGHRRHEWLWRKVCWLVGRQEIPEADYGRGWSTVADLERGRFESSNTSGRVRGEAGRGRDSRGTVGTQRSAVGREPARETERIAAREDVLGGPLTRARTSLIGATGQKGW